MRALIAAAAALMAAANAIADPTPYQPSAASRSAFGHAETQVDANRVRVRF